MTYLLAIYDILPVILAVWAIYYMLMYYDRRPPIFTALSVSICSLLIVLQTGQVYTVFPWLSVSADALSRLWVLFDILTMTLVLYLSGTEIYDAYETHY